MMFGRKNKKRLELLEAELNILYQKVWRLENPPKHKIGDKVKITTHDKKKVIGVVIKRDFIPREKSIYCRNIWETSLLVGKEIHIVRD